MKNQTVLITGSTDGLGKKLAINLAKLGANIIVHGRVLEKCNKVVAELKKLSPLGKHNFIVCDFNKPQVIESKFKILEKQHLDILVNNSGIWDEGNTVDIKPKRILEMMNVNLTSYLIVTRILLPILKKAKFAQILNVSSIAGVEIPEDFYHTIYSATKFGVQAFSEALAKEFTNQNLRIMGYYPGGMMTDLFKKANMSYKQIEPWMFDPQESVDAIIFMLTRNPKVNIKRLDLVNHLEG